MKLNSFCSKINLPKFCAKMGYKDYEFVRIPTFGWFAYSKDGSFIGNIYDLVTPEDKLNLYRVITQEHKDLLEFDLSYSEVTDVSIRSNLLEIQAWNAAYAFARKEVDSFRVTYQGHKRPLKDVLVAHGLNGLLKNRIGVVTQKLIETFNMLPWPKQDIRGKILIPSFCTPSHICSLEYASWNDFGQLFPLFLNDEKGWYGNLHKGRVVANLAEFTTTPGFTWDYKADCWAGNEPVELSEFLDVDTSLKIWKEARNTIFTKSPLEHIKELGQAHELKNHVGNLSYNQVLDVEKYTGEKLTEHWKQAREKQVQLGDRIYVKRDNRYYVYKRGALQEVTNFAVDVESITKKENGQCFFNGFLHLGNQTIPFELPERVFRTNHNFNRAMHDKFISTGLGIPITHPDFSSKALLIILSFNADVKIQKES